MIINSFPGSFALLYVLTYNSAVPEVKKRACGSESFTDDPRLVYVRDLAHITVLLPSIRIQFLSIMMALHQCVQLV